MNTLVTLAVVAVVFALAVLIAMTQELLRLRFRPPSIHRMSGDDVPAEYWRLFASVIDDLAERGFEPFCWVRVELPFVSEWPTEFAPVFRADDGVLAMPSLFDPLNSIQPVELVFASQFEDGRWLRTHNHMLRLHMALDPADEDIDAFADTIAEQLARHRATLRDIPRAVVKPDEAELAEALQANTVRGYDAMFSRELVDSAGGAQFRLLPALRKTWTILTGAKRKPSPQAFLPVDDVPIELKLIAWRRYEEKRDRPSFRLTGLWVLAISAGATLVSFAGWFDLQTAVLLIAVLALHEGGHYFAMIASGYRNVRVFFLPFMGAATTGRASERTLAGELFVLLAGPVPGALLGIGLLAFPPVHEYDWLLEFASLLLVVNLLNLLPLTPLDGGRVVHALVGDVHPMLAHALSFVAVMAFVAAWYWFDEPLALVLAIVVVAALYSSTARLERECRRDGVTDPAEILSRVLAVRGMNGGKARVIMRALSERLTYVQPPTPARVLGGVVYVGVVMVLFGWPLALWASDRQWDHAVANSPIQTIDCQNAALPTFDGNLTLSATYRAAENAERVAAEVGTTMAGYCPRSAWGTNPPSEAEVRARRTLIALHVASWNRDGPNEVQHREPSEAARVVRESGEPWIDEFIVTDYVKHDALTDPIVQRLGLTPCRPEQMRVTAHPLDERLLVVVETYDEPPEAVEPLVQYLCESSPVEVTAY